VGTLGVLFFVGAVGRMEVDRGAIDQHLFLV